MMNEIFLPTLHSFENHNNFSGRFGKLRFYLYPQESTILAKIWHGLFCIEKSDIEAECELPMTQEGIEEMRVWLYAHVEA